MSFHIDSNCRQAVSGLLVTLAFLATPIHLTAAPVGEAVSMIEPGSVLRLDIFEEAATMHLDVPGPGLLTLDATTVGLHHDEIVLLSENWDVGLVTVLESSATHLAVAVHGPGRLGLRAAARHPGSVSIKVLAVFTAATLIEDAFPAAGLGRARPRRPEPLLHGHPAQDRARGRRPGPGQQLEGFRPAVGFDRHLVP